MKATMKKKPAYHKPYDEDYKRQAVELVVHSGKSCEQVARELGCSGYSLQLWKREYLARMGPLEVEGHSMSAEEMEQELRALRKQVHYLERQREILKKAISILGEEPNPGMR
jgi:transposase-like protein